MSTAERTDDAATSAATAANRPVPLRIIDTWSRLRPVSAALELAARVPRPPQPAPPPAPEPTVAHIGPLASARQAREWALVLQSQSIAYIVIPGPDGWVLQLAVGDQARAWEAIELYEAENEDWPPEPPKDRPRHEATAVMALAFFAALMFFLYVTGPAASGSPWFVYGRSDALRLWSEPWRMVTALTLHADAQHIIGNALSGTIFGSMVARRIGPGGALLGVLMSGAIGNFANAVYHLPDPHRSIGASTAVFGAVGILAAVQTMVDLERFRKTPREQLRRRYGIVDMLAPVIGGLALLGTLGSGRQTDLGAHGFGFLAGVGIGVVAGLVVRRTQSQPSRTLQLACGIAACAIVAGSWTLAVL